MRSQTEAEENVKFSILSPDGEIIGVFFGTWEKTTVDKPKSKQVEGQDPDVKNTFNGEIDDKAQLTFLSRLSERRTFRNLHLLIETQDGRRHRCSTNLTIGAGIVKGVAQSKINTDVKR